MKRTIFALTFFSLTLPAFGQDVDPIIGTWKFNPEKSTANFPMLKSSTLTTVRDGQDIINTNEQVNGQGQSFKIVYRHIYDGMPHPTTGSPNYDAIAYTRVGNTINGIRFKNGKPVEVHQTVIVPGQTYTSTAEGIAADGYQYHFVYVWDRQ